MGRDSHSAFKALELLPYYLTNALEEFQTRQREAKRPSLPRWVVAAFSAVVALGIYQEAPWTAIIEAGALFLLAAAAIQGLGWLVVPALVGRWQRRKPLTVDEERARRRADEFGGMGTNSVLLADGLTSCAESGPVDAASNAFFVGEAVVCLRRAAEAISNLTIDEGVRTRAVIKEAMSEEGVTHFANAVNERRVRWAISFCRSVMRRLLSRLDAIDIPHEDHVRAELRSIDEDYLKQAEASLG